MFDMVILNTQKHKIESTPVQSVCRVTSVEFKKVKRISLYTKSEQFINTWFKRPDGTWYE